MIMVKVKMLTVQFINEHMNNGLPTIFSGEETKLRDTAIQLLDEKIFLCPIFTETNYFHQINENDYLHKLHPVYCDFKDRVIPLNELPDFSDHMFGVEVKACYNIYYDIKLHKSDNRTYFLNKIQGNTIGGRIWMKEESEQENLQHSNSIT